MTGKEWAKIKEAADLLGLEYRFPLVPGDDEQFEGNDWWFDLFGHDSHWGKGSMPKEDTEKK
jgi:hypothetical protein